MQYRCIIPLAMIYVLLDIFTQVVGHKAILVPIESIVDARLVLNSGIVIGISWLCLCDIIAEVYGMRISVNLFWVSTICKLIIIIFCYYLMKLSSPWFWNEPQGYNNYFRLLLEVLVGTPTFVIAWFINIYFLTKWKFLLGGRYFWLRSVGASIIGETIFTVSSNWIMYQLGMFLSILNTKELIIRILWGLFLKMVLIAIFAFPSYFIVNILKMLENRNQNNDRLKINPFKYPAKGSDH